MATCIGRLWLTISPVTAPMKMELPDTFVHSEAQPSAALVVVGTSMTVYNTKKICQLGAAATEMVVQSPRKTM